MKQSRKLVFGRFDYATFLSYFHFSSFVVLKFFD